VKKFNFQTIVQIFVLFVLLLVGAFLAIQVPKQSKALSSDRHLLATESIRQLKEMESELNVLVLKSRYGLDGNYDKLAEIPKNIRLVLKQLENRAFTPEVLETPKIKNALSNYSTQIEIKQDVLESFKSHNSLLRNSLTYAPIAGDNLADLAKENNLLEAEQLFNHLNEALYKLILFSDPESKHFIRTNKKHMTTLEAEFLEEHRILLTEYDSHLRIVLDEISETDRYVLRAVEMPTSELLSKVYTAYSEYRVGLVSDSNVVNFGLVVYGLIVSMAMAYFVWHLRRVYMGLEHEVEKRTAEIQQAYDELQESQEQLIQSEKMASLGHMIAGVAHEINTPLGYITSNVDTVQVNVGDITKVLGDVERISKLMERPKPDGKIIGSLVKKIVREYRGLYTKENVDEMRDLLKDSRYGLEEISELVGSLKNFSRLDRSNTEIYDINGGIDNTIKIANSYIQQFSIQVEQDYGVLEHVECAPAKINQVFLNIITNAAQAMPEGGTLTISTSQEKGTVKIHFQDTGTGMSDDTQKKIFDPFYTTKQIGEGTGLGMSIAYKIMKSHGGNIEVSSSDASGTCILVELPVRQNLKPQLAVIA